MTNWTALRVAEQTGRVVRIPVRRAAEMVLRPKLAFSGRVSGVALKLIDSGCQHRRERFDAGIRLGESIEGICLGPSRPDWRLAVVGTPAYFDRHGIRLCRMSDRTCVHQYPDSVNGGVYVWEFEKDGLR
ncbi:hypothetical protein NB646_05895 [Oxalobacter aliiformigenes]|uniref:Uncharacterized protein n=1 Tax=Oxalobacter aliiformigenes TaxID=2946593 RepID=A0A9E9NSG7_9BURK|nr:hypothetical protein [Oxalobacter aliiformigenes]WAV90405.1 hypothetical protein NB646_05895 [Oxalobacter aliiformigenes]